MLISILNKSTVLYKTESCYLFYSSHIDNAATTAGASVHHENEDNARVEKENDNGIRSSDFKEPG